MGAHSLKIKIDDPAVRAELIEQIKLSDGGSRIIEEFTIAKGRARADIVVVNDSNIHAYEIKSDVDNLGRLSSQQRHYSTLFSTVTLVVGMEHAVKAMYLIPDWWGVTVALPYQNGVRLSKIRDARSNENISYISISEVMRKDEIATILKKHAPGKGYSSLSKTSLVCEVKKHIPQNRLTKEFPRIIFERSKPQLV